MRVLLVWEEIPEAIKAYLIEDPTEEQLKVLLTANGTMVNGESECAEGLILSTALGSKEFADPEIPEKWHAVWEKCLVEFPVKGPIDLVVTAGFYL